MSGHSKWSKIKHKKGAADSKKGAVFTKLGNAITVAAKAGGGDADMNFNLRLAMDKAKQANMPKENIERAIKRGTGELSGQSPEETTYEGFAAGKIPIIIECLTDNKNRTVSEIKHILEKNSGAMAGPGSVMWQFEKKGCLSASAKAMADKLRVNNNEDLELKLIDFNIEDIQINNDEVIIYTKPEQLQQVKQNLENQGIKIESTGIEFVAKEKIEVSNEQGEKISKLFEELDEQQDVSNYYTNIA